MGPKDPEQGGLGTVITKSSMACYAQWCISVRIPFHRLSPPPKISLSPKKDAPAKPTNRRQRSLPATPPASLRLSPTSSPPPPPLPSLCVSPHRQTPPPPSPLPPPSVSSAARQSWSSASPGVARWRRRVPGGVCDGADPRRHESGFCVGGERDGESVTRTGEAWGETR